MDWIGLPGLRIGWGWVVIGWASELYCTPYYERLGPGEKLENEMVDHYMLGLKVVLMFICTAKRRK